MKKVVIVSLLFTFWGLSQSFAQFSPIVKLNTEVAIDGSKNFCFGGQFIAGYRINENLIIGAGTGISYTDLLFYPSFSIGLHYYKEYKETGAYVPLFATAKYNFTKEGISPYVSLDAGYSFLVPFSDYASDYVKLGVMFNPHFGVDFPISKGSIGVELGYKYQTMNNSELTDSKMDYNQLTIGVAYNF